MHEYRGLFLKCLHESDV